MAAAPAKLTVPLAVPKVAETAEERLDRRMNQLANAVEDFFDDRDLQIVAASSRDRKDPGLPALAAYIGRIPIVEGHEKRAESRETERIRAKKKTSFAAVGASVATRAVDAAILRYDAIVAGISMVGLCLMLLTNWLAWVSKAVALAQGATLSPTSAPSPHQSLADELGPQKETAIRFLNYVITITSAASVIAIIFYYRLIMRMKAMEWSKLNGKEIIKRSKAYSFWRSSYPMRMALEIGIHCIFPYPWYNVLIDTNSKYLDLCMWIRLYTLLRVLHHISPLYRFRHDIVRANPELKSASFSVGFSDTMKVFFYEYTWMCAFILYFFVTVIGGFCVFIAERDSNNGWDPIPEYPGKPGVGFNSWLDGIYFMVVAVRTIGYGDIVPITMVGRGLTICFQFMGMSVESLLGSIVINKIAKSREEKLIDEYLKSFYAWHEFRVASAMLIQAAWKTSLRYQYINRKVSQEYMERVMRMFKRRKEFLEAKGGTRASTFALPGQESAAIAAAVQGPRMESEKFSAGLKQILTHFSSAKRQNYSGSAALNAPTVESSKSAILFERMPYLKKREVIVDSQKLVASYRLLFTQDVDVSRWGKSQSNATPVGFQPTRTFTATKRVIGKHGERRIPIGEGHKSDLRLEALKQFRKCRLEFKQSLTSSGDHVVDGKLLLAYELLSAASRKLKRNVILLKGLKRVSEIELDSVDQLLKLSMSGGVEL